MRSILKLTVAGVIAASALTPAMAASHHKRAATPAATSEYNGEGYRSAAVAAQRGLPPVDQQPNACFVDEGYGRFSPCDEGGGG